MVFDYKLTGNAGLERLTKANVLKKVTDLDLLSYYVSGFPGPNRSMRSNLRTDDGTASLHFKFRNGKARVSDFGSASHQSMSTLDYLIKHLGYTDDQQGFLSLLDRIRQDFNLSHIEPYRGRTLTRPVRHVVPSVGKTVKDEDEWVIRCRFRKWNGREDKAFWFDQYGITGRTLNLFNAKGLESFTLTKGEKKHTFQATRSNPSYVYLPDLSLGIQGYRRKIYTPYAHKKKGKWFNTLPRNAVLGLHTLPPTGDVLVIETSLKDTMCGYEMFKHDPSISFLDMFSESVFLPQEVWEDLKNRFRVILIHGDNDAPGIKCAKGHCEEHNHGRLGWFTNPINKPEWKDTSDMRKNAGFTATYDFLMSTIESQYDLLSND